MTGERWLWLSAAVTSIAIHAGAAIIALSAPVEPDPPPEQTEIVIDAIPIEMTDPEVPAPAPIANRPTDRPEANEAATGEIARNPRNLESNGPSRRLGASEASDVVADRGADLVLRPDRPTIEDLVPAEERVAALAPSGPASSSSPGSVLARRLPEQLTARPSGSEQAQPPSTATIGALENEAVIAMSEAIRSDLERAAAPTAVIEAISPERAVEGGGQVGNVVAGRQAGAVAAAAPTQAMEISPRVGDGSAVVPNPAFEGLSAETLPSTPGNAAPASPARLGSLGTEVLAPLGLPGSERIEGREEEGRSGSKAAAEVIRFIRDYATGRCFAAMPSLASNDRIVIEGLSNSADRLADFEQRLAAGVDVPVTIQTGRITDAQCRALSFLTYAKDYPVSDLRLQIDRRNIAAGAEITGEISGIKGRTLTLLIVDDEGVVQAVPERFFPELEADRARFVVPLFTTAGLFNTANIALAIATPAPLRTVEEAGQADVEAYFEQLAIELSEPRNARSDLSFAFFYIRGAVSE